MILPLYHPPGLQTSLEQIFLRDLQVPSILFVNQFRTIPYAIGNQNTGVMVDIGQNEGRVVCFFNGAMMEDTVEIVPIGYQSLLHSLSQKDEEQDQKMIVDDLYFNLDNQDSMLYAFLSSLLRCSIDLRKQVVQHVVFVGGGVEAIANFEQRFILKIRELFESKGVVECVATGIDNSNDTPLVKRNVFGVKDGKYKQFDVLASVIMNTPLGVLYPLQFRPALMAWMGGSIMGSIKLSNDEWTHRSNY
jgi:actin-related protein